MSIYYMEAGQMAAKINILFTIPAYICVVVLIFSLHY